MATLIRQTDSILLRNLERDEGWRSRPYRDSKRIWTIGWGTNLEYVTADELAEVFSLPGKRDGGVTQEQARVFMRRDLAHGIEWLNTRYVWFHGLTLARQRVLVEMVYNLGVESFTRFQRMIRALREGHFANAADEMWDSKWRREDVGDARVQRLADTMRRGR